MQPYRRQYGLLSSNELRGLLVRRYREQFDLFLTKPRFLKKRALVLGILASGSSLGGVVLPIMVEHLIQEVGFGWAMRSAAFVILFMMIIANLTVTSRFPHHPKPLVLMEFVRPLGELPFLLVTIGA